MRDQPQPPPHPDRSSALARAYEAAARDAGPAPGVRVAVAAPALHDRADRVLDLLGVTWRTVEPRRFGALPAPGSGGTAPETLEATDVLVLGDLGRAGSTLSAEGRAVVRRFVEEGGRVLATGWWLDALALAWPGAWAVATRVAWPCAPAVDGAIPLGPVGEGPLRWGLGADQALPEVDPARVDVLARVAPVEPVEPEDRSDLADPLAWALEEPAGAPGWSPPAGTPLLFRMDAGEGEVWVTPAHLWMTWAGDGSGDPWGEGEEGPDPTPVERSAAASMVAVVRAVLATR